MNKYQQEIANCATIKSLLEVVNKHSKRSFKDYIKYYLPFILTSIFIFILMILFIIFMFYEFILQLTITFSIIYLLFVWAVFDKYMGLKIFKKIRQIEIENAKD